MSNMHLLKATTAMVWKYYVFNQVLSATIRAGFFKTSWGNYSKSASNLPRHMFQWIANIALTIREKLDFGGVNLSAM